MKYFYDVHNGLSFFGGGGYVSEVSKMLFTSTYENLLDPIRNTVNLELNVGVGNGIRATDAGMAIKEALKECRHHERNIWSVKRQVKGIFIIRITLGERLCHIQWFVSSEIATIHNRTQVRGSPWVMSPAMLSENWACRDTVTEAR